MIICELNGNEAGPALELAWRVFLEFEAVDYTKQGVEEFYRSIHDPQYLGNLRYYGAFEDDGPAGMIATRSRGTHIALFFVEGKCHGQGIGRRLFDRVLEDNTMDILTVNSSPFAVPIYHHLGFEDTAAEQIVNGLIYTPMEYNRFRGNKMK